jgi:hypothetical protein
MVVMRKLAAAIGERTMKFSRNRKLVLGFAFSALCASSISLVAQAQEHHSNSSHSGGSAPSRPMNIGGGFQSHGNMGSFPHNPNISDSSERHENMGSGANLGSERHGAGAGANAGGLPREGMGANAGLERRDDMNNWDHGFGEGKEANQNGARSSEDDPWKDMPIKNTNTSTNSGIELPNFGVKTPAGSNHSASSSSGMNNELSTHSASGMGQGMGESPASTLDAEHAMNPGSFFRIDGKDMEQTTSPTSGTTASTGSMPSSTGSSASATTGSTVSANTASTASANTGNTPPIHARHDWRDDRHRDRHHDRHNEPGTTANGLSGASTPGTTTSSTNGSNLLNRFAGSMIPNYGLLSNYGNSGMMPNDNLTGNDYGAYDQNYGYPYTSNSGQGYGVGNTTPSWNGLYGNGKSAMAPSWYGLYGGHGSNSGNSSGGSPPMLSNNFGTPSGSGLMPSNMTNPSSWMGDPNWWRHHERRNEVSGRDNGLMGELATDKGKLGGNFNQLEREAQGIKEQERRDARLHGGHITPFEQRRLNEEENSLQHQINRDMQGPSAGTGNGGTGNRHANAGSTSNGGTGTSSGSGSSTSSGSKSNPNSSPNTNSGSKPDHSQH